MPVIIRHTNRVYAAQAFIDNVIDAGGNALYIGIGRNASVPWTNEVAPPVPANTKAADNDFWSNLIGIARVNNTNETFLAVPKVNWTSGTIYKQMSDTVDKSNVSVGNQFYCVNSNNIVYSCVLTGSNAASIEPIHQVGEITGSDGIRWKYEYDADTLGTGTMNTINWLPVPNGGTVQTPNFAEAFGANHVMVGTVVPDYAGTGNLIPNEEYRQIGILLNPKTSSGAQCTNTFYAPTGLENVGGDVSDGVVLALDNRVKITRAEGQSETIVSVIEF